LNYLKIPWIVARYGFEAEHLGATLMHKGIIDSLITSDSDTLMFGGASMLRRIKIGTVVHYEEYKIQQILGIYNITYFDMVKIGVVLGCDFADKTKGVGIGTVLKKINNITLTEEQNIAYNHFISDCPFEKEDICKTETLDVNGLITWLVECKNFNEGRIKKMLIPFTV
jgi:5'-3' exonuclease